MAEARHIGRIEAIFRYPVKSMAGESLTAADVGWYGVDGDRRFALRRLEEVGGMPWLTATRLPELLRFVPLLRGEGALATHVRTPDGRELPVAGDELVAEIGKLHGKPVGLVRLDHGIFDETPISVIGEATIAAIARESGHEPDVRRFRPNILLSTVGGRAFEEDEWVGSMLSFGDDDSGPLLGITMCDERCAMLNLDPESARSDPRFMKAAVRMNGNMAGVYATVLRRGRLSAGQRVSATRV
jgi:uncharacterized protein YcbX